MNRKVYTYPAIDSLWFHPKRGTYYRVLTLATLQIDDMKLDFTTMVVYEGVADRSMWVRPRDEFLERFEHVIDRDEKPTRRARFKQWIKQFIGRTP